VALDLEGDGLAAADIHYACVLTGSLEDARAFGREAAEKQRRMLVAAVLRPQDGEDRELEIIGITTEKTANTVVFVVREAERAVERLFRDRRQSDTIASLADAGGAASRGR
jgi:hypothetical protein